MTCECPRHPNGRCPLEAYVLVRRRWLRFFWRTLAVCDGCTFTGDVRVGEIGP